MPDPAANRIRVANAPCSWGVVKDTEGPGAITWLQVLDEIAASGYAGTELGDWGFMPNDPAVLQRELSARRLSMVGAFTPIRLSDPTAHADGEKTALRTARLLAEITTGTPDEGEPFVILADNPGPATHRVEFAGRIRPEHGLDDAGWQALAEGAERIAAAVLDATGLRTAFHHHCGTFVETPAETARLMEMTSPELLGLCFDTGHWAYAGGDPVEALRAYADCVWLVHFKDTDEATVTTSRTQGWDYVKAIRSGIFCDLGEGSIDHAAVFAELDRSGYEGWIVAENESPPGRRSRLESAKQDRAYFASLGL